MWLRINLLLFKVFAILNISKYYSIKYIYCDAHNQGPGEKMWRILTVLGVTAYALSVLLQ